MAAAGTRAGSLTLADEALASTVQTLTQAASTPQNNDVLTQLQKYDADTIALEQQLNLKRDEQCTQLWRRWNLMGESVSSYEYMWCASGWA